MRILPRHVNTAPAPRSGGPAYGSQTEDSVVPVGCVRLVTIKHLLPVFGGLGFDPIDTFATVDHGVLRSVPSELGSAGAGFMT